MLFLLLLKTFVKPGARRGLNLTRGWGVDVTRGVAAAVAVVFVGRGAVDGTAVEMFAGSVALGTFKALLSASDRHFELLRGSLRDFV